MERGILSTTRPMRRILLVEDHPTERREVRRALRSPDREIVEADTVESALEKLQADVDLLLLDINEGDTAMCLKSPVQYIAGAADEHTTRYNATVVGGDILDITHTKLGWINSPKGRYPKAGK